jgi:hypothetical protein
MNEDQIVEDYLRRLEAAAAGLPAGQGEALVAQTAARIADARAGGPQRGTALASVYLRSVLDGLGDPEELARPRKARRGAPDRAAGRDPGAAGARAGGRRPEAGGHEITAVVLLVAGGFLAGLGWLVGLVLLWTSPRWRISDKLLGTVIWPGGAVGALAAPAALFLKQINTGPVCAAGAPVAGTTDQVANRLCPTAQASLALPGWAFVTLLVVLALLAVGGSAWTATRLMRRIREIPAAPPVAAGGRLPQRA